MQFFSLVIVLWTKAGKHLLEDKVKQESLYQTKQNEKSGCNEREAGEILIGCVRAMQKDKETERGKD